MPLPFYCKPQSAIWLEKGGKSLLGFLLKQWKGSYEKDSKNGIWKVIGYMLHKIN